MSNTIEVTIKTLDSQNHSYTVPAELTVKEFKETIAPSLGIPADKQRLIFCGRVLQDDKKLSEFDVNGKVIHLVQRPPPQASSTTTSSGASSSNARARTPGHQQRESFLLGAFTIPQDMVRPAHVQQIVQDVVSSMGDIGRNATVMYRTSDDGSSMDVHINLGEVPFSDVDMRLDQVQGMIAQANRLLVNLEVAAAHRDNSSMQVDEQGSGSLSESQEERELNLSGSSSSSSSNNSSSCATPSQNSPVRASASASSIVPDSTSETQQAQRLAAQTPTSSTASASGPSARLRDCLAQASRAAVVAAAVATSALPASLMIPHLLSGHGQNAGSSQSGMPAQSAGVSSSNSAGSASNSTSNAAPAAEVNGSQSSGFFFPSVTNLGSTFGIFNSGHNSGAIPTQENSQATDQSASSGTFSFPFPNIDVMTNASDMFQDMPVPGAGRSNQNTEQTSNTQNEPRTSTGEASQSTSAPNERSRSGQSQRQMFASYIHEIEEINTRLQPHLKRNVELLRNDPVLNPSETRDAIRNFSWLSELFHCISHAYHSLSDLMVSFREPPPRDLRALVLPPAPSPATIFHAGVPVQAQISVNSFRTSPGDTQNTSTTTTAPSTTAATPNPAAAIAAATVAAVRAAATAAAATVSSSAANTTTRNMGSSTTTANTAPTSTATSGTTGQTPGSPWQPVSSMAFTSASSANPLGASFPAGAAMFGGQNPVVFMEVGPSTITIDSISTAVVNGIPEMSGTSGATQTSTTTTSSASNNHSMRTPTETSSENAQATSTTSSNSNFSNSNPNSSRGPTPLRNFGPVSLAVPGMRNSPFDPCLPCNSRWSVNPTSRRRLLRPRTTAGAAQARTNTEQNTAGVPEDPLHHIISSVMSTLLNQPHLQMQGARSFTTTIPPPTAASQPTFAAFSRIPPPTGGTQPTQQDNLAQLIEEVTPIFTSRGTVPPTSTSQPQPQNQLTIADVVLRYGDSPFVEGECMITDLFISLARILTFEDLRLLAFGHSEPLSRIHENLKQFILQRMLTGQEPNEENIDRAVENLILLIQPVLEAGSRNASIKPDIDYIATITNFARHNLRNVINLVLNQDAATFGAALYSMCRNIMSEFLVLNISCFSDGTSSLENVIQGMLRYIVGDINPIYQHWIVAASSALIRSNIHNLNVPPDQVQHFLVTKKSPQVADSGVSTSTTSDEQMDAESSHKNIPCQSTTSSSTPKIDSYVQDDTVEQMEVESLPNVAENLLNSNSHMQATNGDIAACGTENNLRDSNDEINDISIGSEPWHASVPREWIPIITRDVQRQRRHAPQPPFSDAYLGGMPSKRRKVSSNAAQGAVGPIHNILPDALQCAIVASGVQPLTSMEEVKHEAAQDSALHSAYKEQVKHTVRERLNRDLDYSPERFPNSERYFKGGN